MEPSTKNKIKSLFPPNDQPYIFFYDNGIDAIKNDEALNDIIKQNFKVQYNKTGQRINVRYCFVAAKAELLKTITSWFKPGEEKEYSYRLYVNNNTKNADLRMVYKINILNDDQGIQFLGIEKTEANKFLTDFNGFLAEVDLNKYAVGNAEYLNLDEILRFQKENKKILPIESNNMTGGKRQKRTRRNKKQSRRKH